MIRKHFNLNKKRTALILAALFVLTGLIVSAAGLFIAGFFQKGSYDLEEAACENIVPGDEWQTTGEDPKIVITGIDRRVRYLDLDIENTGDEAFVLQIFYAGPGEDISEENAESFSVEPGENEFSIYLDRKISTVRIDPGTEAGVTFSADRLRFDSMIDTPWSLKVFIIRVILLTLVIFFVLVHFVISPADLYGFIYRRRYLLGIAAIIICTALDINGSSISRWDAYVNSGEDTVVFGTPRGVRSDEWAVWTPMIISQEFTSDPYSAVNDVLRGTDTDVNMHYALPAKNISLLYRPFLAGFVILGSERGLAFFWSARLVFLLLAMFELFMLITKGRKALSGAAAVMVAFSPLVQWWFAINSLVEMLIFGSAFIVCLYHYLYGDGSKKRWLFLLIMVISAGGYVLTIYPAWMVPFAYAFLALFLWVIFGSGKMNFKKKYFIEMAVAVIFLALTVGYVMYSSRETISVVMNTAYPGSRKTYGGGALLHFIYPSNILYGFNSQTVSRNACELSSFVSLFPLDLILGLICLIKKKGKDMLLPLIAAGIFLDVYCMKGLPHWLGDISLMSHSTTVRAEAAAMFIHLLVLIRVIAVLREEGSLIKKKSLSIILVIASAVIAVVFAVMIVRENTFYMLDYMQPFYWWICLIVMIITAFLAMFSVKNEIPFVVFISVISIASGIMVNPIQAGLGGLYDTKLSEEVRGIVSEEPDALWVVDYTFPINNYTVMMGAKTVNDTNIYPALERWESLDPDGRYYEIYNRYAHIDINAVPEEAEEKFELMHPDQFRVNLTVDELKDLGVRYIMTPDVMGEEFGDDAVTERAFEDGYHIYELKDAGA